MFGHFRILHKEGNVIECGIPGNFEAENEEGYNGLRLCIKSWEACNSYTFYFLKKLKYRIRRLRIAHEDSITIKNSVLEQMDITGLIWYVMVDGAIDGDSSSAITKFVNKSEISNSCLSTCNQNLRINKA